MSVLEDARKALEKLQAITGKKEQKAFKKERIGVIYSLTAKNKVYVGYEYEDNVEKQVKDLLVRARSYEELGYLYEASYEVLKYDKIKLEVIFSDEVKNKNEMAMLAFEYIKRFGVKCVNIWNPIDILNGEKPEVISKKKNIQEYIKSIDARKKEVENSMFDEYIADGNSKYEANEKVKETYKLIMVEIRKDKDHMFENKIDILIN